MNITLGPKEERLLMTGLHTVADIYCTCCNTVLGWKYVRHMASTPQQTPGLTSCLQCTVVYFENACGEAFVYDDTQERAFEESQKYKEGKYILEKAKLAKVSSEQAVIPCRSMKRLTLRSTLSCSDILQAPLAYAIRLSLLGDWHIDSE